MNVNDLKLLLLFAFIFTSNAYSQELDLSTFELEAHYPLFENGRDTTENYDSIKLVQPIFSFDGLYSRGCYLFDSLRVEHPECIIETAHLDPLNQQSYAISLDFRVSSFSSNGEISRDPIIVLGHLSRFLGLTTNETGSLYLLTNNYDLTEIEGTIIELDRWYNATIIHNKLDFTTQVYIDHTLVFTKVEPLNSLTDDANISNLNFASGTAFHGYWKDLKIYSTEETITQIENSNTTILFNFHPNPTDRYLNLTPNFSEKKFNYTIVDMTGSLIRQSKLISSTIDVQNLERGIYILSIYMKSEQPHRTKFIKI